MLAKLDASLHARSWVAWVLFRTVAGLLVAIGLFAWVGVWFQRGFWLGVAQAAICVFVLAEEIGILPKSLRGDGKA